MFLKKKTDMVTADQALPGRDEKIPVPATHFVNGRPLGGARPELEFRLLFSEELLRAKDALDSGVAPDELYEHLAGLGE